MKPIAAFCTLRPASYALPAPMRALEVIASALPLTAFQAGVPLTLACSISP